VDVWLHAFLTSTLDGDEWSASRPGRFTPPQEKSHWYPLDRRVGGPQNRSGRGGEGKNSQPLPVLEPPIIQPVVEHHTTELSRLHSPGRTEENYEATHHLSSLHEQFLCFDEVFSGYQPRKVSMEPTFRSLMMWIEMVLETSVSYRYLSRLIAREDFIEFRRRESSGSYFLCFFVYWFI
jgi:hypothetical protein